jgi:pimeloyl-ACP methyl ester carboxylesterase
MKHILAFSLLIALSLSPAVRAENSAITADPPRDTAFPPAMDAFQIPTHGKLVNALAYLAAGPGPHPTVVLLHGFPGNERNLDLAQAIRRAHCIEDAEATLAWLRQPVNAARLRTDPARLVLVGHSMGGFVALETTAHDPAVKAVITISAADMSEALARDVPKSDKERWLAVTAARLEAEGLAPLARTSAKTLAAELAANAERWRFATLTPGLANRQVLAITSDDGLTLEVADLIARLRTARNTQAREIHIATDHAYSDRRIALTEAVLAELDRLGKQP